MFVIRQISRHHACNFCERICAENAVFYAIIRRVARVSGVTHQKHSYSCKIFTFTSSLKLVSRWKYPQSCIGVKDTAYTSGSRWTRFNSLSDKLGLHVSLHTGPHVVLIHDPLVIGSWLSGHAALMTGLQGPIRLKRDR